METQRWFDQKATRRSTKGRSLVIRAVSPARASAAPRSTSVRRARRRSSALWPGIRSPRTASPIAPGEAASGGTERRRAPIELRPQPAAGIPNALALARASSEAESIQRAQRHIHVTP